MENFTIQNKLLVDRKQYFSQTEICDCFTIKPSQFLKLAKDANIILFPGDLTLYTEKVFPDDVSTSYMRKKDLKKLVNEMLKT